MTDRNLKKKTVFDLRKMYGHHLNFIPCINKKKSERYDFKHNEF